MSSSLSRADVEWLADLAHLELNDDEINLLTRQLADFLTYARQVQEIPTDGVPPTTHVLAPATRLREDEPLASLPTREALANAPEADRVAGLFKVPRVIG